MFVVRLLHEKEIVFLLVLMSVRRLIDVCIVQCDRFSMIPMWIDSFLFILKLFNVFNEILLLLLLGYYYY